MRHMRKGGARVGSTEWAYIGSPITLSVCVSVSLCGAVDQTQGPPCTANELCPQFQEALIGVIQRTQVVK